MLKVRNFRRTKDDFRPVDDFRLCETLKSKEEAKMKIHMAYSFGCVRGVSLGPCRYLYRSRYDAFGTANLTQRKTVMIITYEKISKRAYKIWENEGKPSGRDSQHWLQAEAELRTEGLKRQKGNRITSRDPAMLKTPRGEDL